MIHTLPPLGSTVRIVSIGLRIWPEAERFLGADCTLCAVFMTGDTLMVAVEHQAEAVCCCFVADMVRTPEQIAMEEREASIMAAMEATYTLGISNISKRILIERLYDAGHLRRAAS
ncbi:hypothetical protein SAMN03159424_04392 [Pseudomonas sp. NFACC05-1]|nr:hypothetical protein SAMN03159424_04392 [Pseudomonas sp. NFACC05-1]